MKKLTEEGITEDELAIICRYNQQVTKINPNEIEKAKRTPRYTAIPLPPLNFNQMGKICPRKHKRADR